MSSVLSTWFYVFTLGIAAILLTILVFVYYYPSLLLQLTSKSGQSVDLSAANSYDPANAAGTWANAVIKIGGNSYNVANTNVAANANLTGALVNSTAANKAAADDLAASSISGKLLFWLLMLGLGGLAIVFAYIASSYPEMLFGDQVSALIRCLPKTPSPCAGGCAVADSAPMPTYTQTQTDPQSQAQAQQQMQAWIQQAQLQQQQQSAPPSTQSQQQIMYPQQLPSAPPPPQNPMFQPQLAAQSNVQLPPQNQMVQQPSAAPAPQTPPQFTQDQITALLRALAQQQGR